MEVYGLKNKKIHFIGIGGIGVSSLAKYYLSQGAGVSGSDLMPSEICDDFKNNGIKINIGRHKKSNLPKDADQIIYTAATPSNNLELLEARRRNLPCNLFAEAVGDLTKKYKTITVSGSHGKSTTAALCAMVLEEGYFDPTVIIGTKLKEFGNSNFKSGSSRYLVLEADEYNKSFLNYQPQIAIITNIDIEHLDTYKTPKEIEKTFEKYLAKVPSDGFIIANRDDARTYKVAKKFEKKVIWYSLKDDEAARVRRILKIPGEHNISNALASLNLGRLLGVCEPDILHALSSFTGSWRRFEFRGMLKGAFIYSDYGHHPTEIKATIKAARERFPFRRIWCIYQPHHYHRLISLWDDFIQAFDMADRICLLPLYDVAGRDSKISKRTVSSAMLTDELLHRGKNVCYVGSIDEAREVLDTGVRSGDVILIMGAGDIYKLY